MRGEGTSNAGSPAVSIVIPVKNAPENLARLLKSIQHLQPIPGGYEVVVCDNGSTDATPQVARDAGCRVLHLPGLSIAGLRNRGAQEGRGQILAFVDSDCEVGPEWLHFGLQQLAQPGVVASGCYPSPPLSATWVQELWTLRERLRPPVHDADWLPSMNLLIHRRDFEAVGGFDVSLKTCEDVDFCYRLRGKGGKIRWDSRIAVIHHGEPETLRRLFQKERWHGQDNYRGVLKHGLRLEELPSLIVPPLVLGAFVIPLGALALSPVLTPLPGLVTLPLLGFPLGLAALRAAKVVHQAGRWQDFPRLSTVYLVFFSARAAAIVWT